MRSAQFYRRDPEHDWRDHTGSSPAAQERFARWKSDMHALADLLDRAFAEERVIVTENLRLRLGSGKAHEETIHPMIRRRIGEAFTRDQIDAAGTPALWTALTHDPDFDPRAGLPANSARKLRLHGTLLSADDTIDFFSGVKAAKHQISKGAKLAVRGGWAQLGDSIHHARIYRWEEKGKPKYGMLRVFTADLLRHRHENLFTVEPKPNWVSMRVAHSSIGRADLSEKEYLGWLVPGDELLVANNPVIVPRIGEVRRWKVRGFEDENRFNVEPRHLASEGLDRFVEVTHPENEEVKAIRDLIAGKGRRTVNKFFTEGVVVIRRDALGRPRLESRAGLPVSWRAT